MKTVQDEITYFIITELSGHVVRERLDFPRTSLCQGGDAARELQVLIPAWSVLIESDQLVQIRLQIAT